ncbi:MAG: histone deacetylase, partial [Gemmatimonadota bacterium]
MDRLPVVWHEAYEVDLGEHVYPTAKYRLVRDRLEEEGLLDRVRLLRPDPAPRGDLERVHRADYLRKIREGDFTRQEELRLEVPFSAELRRAMRLACGGTTLAARRALDAGLAVHLGGGFHHAFADHGEGFCLLNDSAVALRALLAEGRIGRAAVVDCDVHHGNGTARIFADAPEVFTLSLHQERLYPARKPPSDLDVG